MFMMYDTSLKWKCHCECVVKIFIPKYLFGAEGAGEKFTGMGLARAPRAEARCRSSSSVGALETSSGGYCGGVH